MTDQPQPAKPEYNPSAPHQIQPKLRRIRVFPLPVKTPDGQEAMAMGIADAQQISPKIVGTNPAFQAVLPLLDGSRNLDQVLAEVGKGLERPVLEEFVAQLDDAALLEGPPFDAMLEEAHARFDESDILPPGSTADFADALVKMALGKEAQPTEQQLAEQGPAKLAEQFDKWMGEALKDEEVPSLDQLPKAIIAPHLDYPRGWSNYASIYGRVRVCDRPDRVVILGTNHFGFATGVCGCDKGYRTPLGTCPPDTAMIDRVRSNLGDDNAAKLFVHRYDHENEHSIELHIPWVQHVFGQDDQGDFVPVFSALVHDPAANNGASYDGEGLDLDPFVDALKKAIADLGGRTLIVASADLSHAGPMFGDKQRVFIPGEGGDEEVEGGPEAKAFRDSVAKHDHEMLEMVKDAKPAELVGAMAWQQNPTRWCSVGNLVAMMQTTDAQSVEILRYNAAIDQGGNTMVSSIAGFVA